MGQLLVLAVVSSDSMKEQLGEFFRGKESVFCKILEEKSDGYINYINAYGLEYDVVISCASAYEKVSAAVDKCVVRVDISFQDVLRAVLMAKNYGGGQAFVGSEDQALMAEDACRLMNIELNIAQVDEEVGLDATLEALKEEGTCVVIGDEQVSAAARDVGLAVITVIPGTASVTAAASSALIAASAASAQSKQLELIRSTLSASDFLMLVFSPEGELLFSSSNDPEYTEAIRLIHSQPVGALPKKTMLRQGAYYWSIEKRSIYLKKDWVICLMIRKQAYDVEDNAMRGIMVAGHSDLSKHEISEGYLDSIPQLHQLAEEARSYAKLPSPTVIYGEAGVGKNIFANIIHKCSHYRDNHVVVIDCEQVELPTWAKLLHESRGILAEDDVVYYFKNFEQTPAQIQDQLLQHLGHMQDSGRNKLVFSYNCHGSKRPDTPLTQHLIYKLHTSWIYVPPLRERPNELGSLSSVYINSLGAELGSEVIGLEPNAVSLLKEYYWPGNLNQFRRFIAELMVSTKGYYISARTVSMELKREMNENAAEASSAGGDEMDLTGSLEEIERRIILRILQEERQNQTAAAKRLGVSRSTLWRKLKG